MLRICKLTMKLVFILLCNIILIIYCIKTITCSQWDKSKNVEIDDFINKLLSSKKFDELADKIIDKAVQRIRGLGYVDHKILREDTKEKYGDFSRNNKNPKPDRFSTEKQLNVNIVKQRKPTNMLIDEKGDTEVFFAKNVSSPREQFRLKYKYLTRGAIDNTVKKRLPLNKEKQNDIQINSMDGKFEPQTSTKHYVGEEKPVKNYKSRMEVQEKEHKNKKEKLVSKFESDNPENVQIYMKSNRDISSEQPHAASEKETKVLIRDSKEKKVTSQDQGKSNSEISEETPNENTNEKNEGDVSDADEEEMLKNNETEDITEHDTEVKTTIYTIEDLYDKETEVPYNSNSIKEDKQHNNESYEINKNTESVENREENVVKAEMHEVTTKKVESTTKLRIRKEGNKVYTFENSPDYDEYHENVDKVKNTKQLDILL